MSMLAVLLIIFGSVLFTTAALWYAVRAPAGRRTSAGHRVDRPPRPHAKATRRHLYAR